MDYKSISVPYQGILDAYKERKKRHLPIRLCRREVEGLAALAEGKSTSAAMEEVIATYLQTMKRPDSNEKLVKKTSFVISADLWDELNAIAISSNTTISAIVHAALRDALPPE